MLIIIVSVGCAKLCSTIVVILYRIQYSSRLPFDDSPGEAVCPPQFLKVKAKITHEGLNYCLCTTRLSLRRNVSFAIPSNQKKRSVGTVDWSFIICTLTGKVGRVLLHKIKIVLMGTYLAACTQPKLVVWSFWNSLLICLPFLHFVLPCPLLDTQSC